MTSDESHRSGFPRLEALLAFAFVALIYQLFPASFVWLFSWLDVRQWTRPVWFVANLLLVLILVGVRFGPDWRRDWHERRERLARERAQAAQLKQRAEQKEMLERLNAGRKRRLY